MERRHSTELRAAGERKLVGRVPYGSEARVNNRYREVLAPLSLRPQDDTLALFNHDPSALLGRTSNGTLKLSNSPSGLEFEVSIPDTSSGRDLMVLVERGDLRGVSFGFICEKDAWEGEKRTILAAALHEISLCTAPVYGGTTIAARSKDRARLPGIVLARRLLTVLERAA